MRVARRLGLPAIDRRESYGGRRAEANKGTMWLVRRSRDLVPALVALAVREWLTAEDEVTERELVPVSEHPST